MWHLAAPEASSDDASSDDASSDDAVSDVASDDFDSVVELSVLSPQATSDNPIASANERANAFLIFLTKKPSF